MHFHREFIYSKAYEHGEIEKSYIFPTRFQQYLGEMGIETDYLAANGMYADGLEAAQAFDALVK